jgi:hypothetical protein
MNGAAFPRPFGGMAEPMNAEVGKNSEVFNIGDLVFFNTDGMIEVVDTTLLKIEGISKEKDTMSATNQTVELKTQAYTPVEVDQAEFEMDFDADVTATNRGAYYTIAGGTGAQKVTFASASDTVGQVYCVKVDPRGEGDLRRGLFRVAKPSQLSD